MAKELVSEIKEVLSGGIRSPDGPTRRASWLFVLCGVGILVTIVLGVQYFFELRAVKNQALKIAEAQKAERDRLKAELELRKKSITYSLGQFTLELREKGGRRPPRGMNNLAEIEIVIRCDTQSTCDLVKENILQARDQVTHIFTPMDREVLLSLAGKQALRKTLTEHLNRWIATDLPAERVGKISELYFASLIIN